MIVPCKRVPVPYLADRIPDIIGILIPEIVIVQVLILVFLEFRVSQCNVLFHGRDAERPVFFKLRSRLFRILRCIRHGKRGILRVIVYAGPGIILLVRPVLPGVILFVSPVLPRVILLVGPGSVTVLLQAV